MTHDRDNPLRQASALQYKGVGAPRVIAKGQGETAARIEEIARQHDIPLFQDSFLTSMLADVSLGDEIPENLYVAVAEVLAYIYRIGDSLDESL